MYTDSAYRRNLPCLNTNCKSHGRPHPNCRCYGFAKGGEVDNFCSGGGEHMPDCEYFAGGGTAAPDFIPDEAPDFIPDTHKDAAPDFIPDEKQDGGVGGTIKASAQGLLEGAVPFAAPIQIATGLRTKEDLDKEREEHPLAHGLGETAGFVGSLMTPMSIFGAIGKGAEGVAHAAEIGKLGSTFLKGAAQTAALTTSDEMTKSLLGHGDPEHPVSAALLNIGAAGLLGGAASGVFTLGEGLIGKGVASEAGAKAAGEAQDFLFNLGKSDNPAKILGITSVGLAAVPAYKTSRVIEDKTGLPAWMTFPFVEGAYARLGYKGISKINPYITAAAVKALSENEASGIPNVFHYVSKAVVPGVKKGAEGVSALFKAGTSQIAPAVLDSEREQLKEFIKSGGADKQLQNSMQHEAQGQNFAHGGEVQSEPNQSFAKIYPEQNTVLSAAKGRISKYLNSLRPQENQPKAVFDDAPKDTEKHRVYDRAIDLAVRPMGILDRVNKGDITPEHVMHFNSLYPEVHKFLSNEMTKQITEAQLKGEKPPYNKRMAMSLFLGADLDSSFSPIAIQTIQGLYANQKASAQQQQAPAKNKKGTSTLGKGPSAHLTDDQARETRLQNQKA